MKYGIILICISSDHTDAIYTYDKILNLYRNINFIIFGTDICCIGQIIILNQGLKHYSSLHMLPLYQRTFILIGSITNVIFFHEYNNM